MCFGSHPDHRGVCDARPSAAPAEAAAGVGAADDHGNTAQLLELLDRGEIDFAIVEGFFPKQAYDGLVYRRERYLPVCAPGYRFAGRFPCWRICWGSGC